MIDWTLITGFDWDAGNEAKSEIKHGVNCQEVEELFTNRPLLLLTDEGHSTKEQRWRVLGKTNKGRALHAAFTIRRNCIRPISVRPMNRKEKAIYEKAS